MSRWTLPLALALLLAVPASAADQSVTAQSSLQWVPNDVTIDMGDTVTWSNAGGIHNVEFDDGSYTQPPAPSSDDWSVQRSFDTPGQFFYHCGLHGPSMAGVVRVRDASGEVPPIPAGLTVRAADEQPLGRLERKGLRVRASCDNRCDISMKMSLGPRTAKRFGFAKRRKTIGREVDAIAGGETERFFVDLNSKAEDALADAERAFKVRLDVRATATASETAREKIKITP